MIEIVIKYDEAKQQFLVYEPTTNTVLVSTNLTESLIKLNDFLKKSGLSQCDILGSSDISYHIDSMVMRTIVEGNVNLLKRLNQAPGSFTISNQRFGGGGQNKSSSPGTWKENGKKVNRSKSEFASSKAFKGAFKRFGNG